MNVTFNIPSEKKELADRYLSLRRSFYCPIGFDYQRALKQFEKSVRWICHNCEGDIQDFYLSSFTYLFLRDPSATFTQGTYKIKDKEVTVTLTEGKYNYSNSKGTYKGLDRKQITYLLLQ